MSKKGDGKKIDLVPQLLRGIRDDMQGIRDDMKAFREDVNRGFTAVNDRLDGIIEITGSHWRDHEERIKTLEQRVDRLER